VVIATSSDGDDATTRIENFADRSVGDVLLVKQMASVGLDVPRLKVMLDLSPVRTAAAFIQRLMRIATVRGRIRHAVYVCPDDVLGRGLFDLLIRDQGGESVTSCTELVASYEKEKKEPDSRPVFTINGTADADFGDSDANRTPKELLPQVDRFLRQFPEVASVLTLSEIARRLSSGHEPSSPVASAVAVEDTATAIRNLQRSICEAVNVHLRSTLGHRYDKATWVEKQSQHLPGNQTGGWCRHRHRASGHPRPRATPGHAGGGCSTGFGEERETMLSEREKALSGPRDLKTPGSLEWCWQAVEHLKTIYKSRVVTEDRWAEGAGRGQATSGLGRGSAGASLRHAGSAIAFRDRMRRAGGPFGGGRPRGVRRAKSAAD